MKRIKLYTCLLFIVVINFSCKKYLDKLTSTSLSTPSTLNALQGMLDHSNNMIFASTPSFGEASSDDYFVLDKDYNTRNERLRSMYIWEPIDYIYNNDWAKSYSIIYCTNVCLESLENIAITAQNTLEWNNVKGASLFFRSNMFLSLLWTFAKAYDPESSTQDLGIDLRLESDFQIPSKRSSVEEGYQLVIKDLKKSIPLLPEITTHVFRPGKAAAYGLLARAYLSMRIYDSALHYSNLALSLKNELIDYNTVTNNNSPFAVSAYSNETIFFSTMLSFLAFDLITPSRGKVDTSLYASYLNGDLRKSLYFTANSGYYQFKGSSATSSTNFFSGLATNEMYLIRSECNARAGLVSKALEDLNYLLKKRWNKNLPYQDLTANSAPSALNLILTERRKELLMRGLRWIDIKRLNKEGKNIVLQRKIEGKIYQLQPNAAYYALPLPTDIINITGMPQNLR